MSSSGGQTALLLMDMMNGVVGRYAAGGGDDLVERLAVAAGAARARGVAVIHVRVAFRPGYPEVSPRNRTFSTLATRGGFAEDDPATAIVAGLAPQEGDLVVLKRRVSAFAGSDLELVVRALDIDTLVLTGIATSGVVLSTLREAADRDYRLEVLADGCLDADPEVHRVLVEKVFPRQAEVRTVEEWVAAL